MSPRPRARSLERVSNAVVRDGELQTYAVLRRSGWEEIAGLREAAKRAESALGWTSEEVCWVRSYFLAEADGSVGTVCIYRAASPEAVRAHAARARLPVDEIVAVTETVVVEGDPAETAT
jgi:hypothetical protein